MSKKNHKFEQIRMEPLFKALLPVGTKTIEWRGLISEFKRHGLDVNTDPRFKPIINAWKQEGKPKELDLDTFIKIAHQALLFIEKATQSQLIIPEFDIFAKEIEQIYLHTKNIDEGKVADYIPQLSRVPRDKFSVAICTIDGQRRSFGDSEDMFCVQSTCKPISYCLALEDSGIEKVHSHVGREPSGHSFNELSLNHLGLPHNPMINAGAIMTSALIKPELSRADRFDYVIEMWARLMGGQKPSFSNPVYLSERETADRNFALGYFMREHGAFPENTNLIETLEFYFQCCSLEVNTDRMSVLAATLANGGVCPLTGDRVLQPDTVQHCLSLMYSCGMYDFSGEWAFSVGLPAKSGVSGALMVVVPNVLGFCTWAPPLDKNGNSIKGIEFCKEVLRKYNFHNFDYLLQDSVHKKTDPRCVKLEEKSQRNSHLLWACATNDLREIKSLASKGVDLTEADYDRRTAMHLAASEGHLEAVKLLAHFGVPFDMEDRWNQTPLDDAKRGAHKDVVDWLSKHTDNNVKKEPAAVTC